MSPTLLGALFGMTAALLVFGLFRNNRPDRISRRVERLGRTETKNELDASFYERVLDPIVRAVVDLISRLLPTRVIGAVSSKIEETGGGVTISRFIAIWVVVTAVWSVIGAVLLIAIIPGAILLLAIPAWVGLGVYIPWLMLRRRAKQRVKQIDKDLPDAIDLIVTSVESGLGLQASMMKVTEFIDGPISEEFARSGHEVGLGRSRAEALAAMGDRCGSRELRLFVRAVNEAEQMGISVARVLRNQSGEIRDRRRQLAREKAATIPVKITIPTVLFIFPTLFLLILGPVALRVIEFFDEQ